MSALQGVRIARVATVPIFIAAHLKHQIAALSDAGMSVDVITSQGPEVGQIDWSDNLAHIEVEIPRNISPLRDLKSLLRLLKILRQGNYDIIHSNTPKAGLLTAIAGWLVGAPIRLHTFTGQPWVTRTGPVRWVSRNSDRLIGKLCTHCYADSASQRQFIIDEGLIPAHKISVIGDGSVSGINLQRFSEDKYSSQDRTELRDKLGLKSDDKVILFLGRVGAEKGILELLEAFSSLGKADEKLKLLIVGPLESGNGLSQDNLDGVPGVVQMGYTKEPERLLSIADCLCLPSYREGFGSVVLEAAAMGVPSVATRIYGLTDAVVEGETGLLVEPKDPEDLEHALHRIMNDDELREQLGVSAKKRVHDLFDSERVSRLVVEEYSRWMKQLK